MSELINPEELFKEIYVDLLKPFSLIIGNKTLSIAYSVFDSLSSRKEISAVNKKDYSILIDFKPNTLYSKKIEILSSVIPSLIAAFKTEVGDIAPKMIAFAIKDYVTKYKLPIILV